MRLRHVMVLLGAFSSCTDCGGGVGEPDAGDPGWSTGSSSRAGTASSGPGVTSSSRTTGTSSPASASSGTGSSGAEASSGLTLSSSSLPHTDGGAFPAQTGPLDPAPMATTPGIHSGAGCPMPSDTVFQIDTGNETTYRFTGTVTGVTTTGTFYVYRAAGEEIVGPLETDSGGYYSVSLPLFCGTQVVKLVWVEGACTVVLVYDVTSAACTKIDLRVSLMWDALGSDWELHLVKPGGQINNPDTDCTWNTCISVRPDWGIVGDTSDDPRKDVDDLTAYGPESIYLSALEPGDYTVMVEHWGASGSAESDGQVIINLGGQAHVFTRENLASHHVWTVATVRRDGVVTGIGTNHDCTANWISGCRDAIP